MLELVKYIVETFAEHKDQIKYDVVETDTACEIIVSLVASDMGKVIGRQGKIAKALRTLVHEFSGDGKTYNVEIKELVTE